MMKPKINPFIRCALLAAATLACSHSAQAVIYYWDPDGSGIAGFGTAGGTWGTSAFWGTNSAGSGATANTIITTADDVNFGSASAGLAAGTINGPATAQGFLNMTFGSASGAITLSGGVLNLDATTGSTITINNSSDTISTVLQGSGGKLIKVGTGTLTLNNHNTYTGGTTVNGGTLVLAGSNNGTGTIGGTLTINSGATVRLDTQDALGYTGNYVSQVNIIGGTLDNVGTVSSGNGNNGLVTTFTLTGGTMSGSGKYNFNPGYGITTNASSSTSTVSAGIVLRSSSNNMNFNVADGLAATDLLVSSVIEGGSNGITKTGAGTMTLSGANTYTGSTTINAGALKLQNTYASSSFAIASGALLDLNVASGSRDGATTTFSGAGTLRKTGAGTALWGGGAATFALGSGSLIDVQEGSFTGGSNANEVWTNNKSDLNVASGAVFKTVEANVRVNKITGSGTIGTGYSGAGYSNFTIGVDNGSSTFDGVIQNTDNNASFVGNLVKAGTGTITLTGNNTYTGGTAIDNGTLVLDGPTGPTGTIRGTLTINSGATVKLNKKDVLGYTGGSGYVSQVNINGGILDNVSNDNNGYSTSFTLTGGTMTASTGSGSYHFNTGSGITTNASANTSTVSARIELRNSNNMSISVADGVAANDLLISGAITGVGGGITKSGAGTMVLSAVNNYTGLTTVSGGALNITSSGSLNSGNALSIDASGTADFANAGQTLGAVNNSNTASNALNFSAGTGTVTLASLSGTGNTRFGSNGAVTGGISTGTVNAVGLLTANISGGTVGAGSLSSSTVSGGTITVSGVAAIGTMSSGTANLSGATSAITTLNGGTVNLGSSTVLTVNDGNTSGSITGSGGGLTKSGAGTLTLASGGTYSYTGNTNITGGKLVVNGNISTNSLTTVSGSATLGGTGTVGNTTVNGVFAPGNSIGTLNVSGSLILAGSADFEIDPTNGLGLDRASDLANVSGVITYGGILNVIYGGSASDFTNGMVFNLFDGASFTGSFNTLNLPALDAGLSWQDNLATNGTLTVVPEPGAALLGGLGMLALLRRRR